MEPITPIINAANQRQGMDETTQAYRLFNGFYEGLPGLVLDRYGSTLVIFNHADPGEHREVIERISHWALTNLDGISSILLKERQSPENEIRSGRLLHGKSPQQQISEYDVHYALDLQMNQDAGFYLDTRHLRRWLYETMPGKRVLNTFAYTGSLGVAAGAGGAVQVIQTDLSKKFLNLAKRSWTLNQLDDEKCTYIPGDFFRVTGQMRREERLFDCVILDPPFFSDTDAGRIELERDTLRMVNKVRPLVAHRGWLVVVNNALYLPGVDFMAVLQALCDDEHLSYERMIPVPQDITGFPAMLTTSPPVDPSPFNHPTKIAVLRAFRKDQKT